jgi:hypothetical protein
MHSKTHHRLAGATLLALLLAGCGGPTDVTPANPPGTAALRGLDRAAGTNTSGAYPMQSDGMPGNPRGTEAGRAVDRAFGAGMPGSSARP